MKKKKTKQVVTTVICCLLACLILSSTYQVLTESKLKEQDVEKPTGIHSSPTIAYTKSSSPRIKFSLDASV